MKIQLFAAVVIMVALSSCQTKTKVVEEMSYSERKALAGVITRRCVEQGYTEKSPEFVPCIKAETEGETARRRRARLHSELMAIATQRVTCVKISGVMRCN
ncbi:hypothetical protein HR059_13360 [Sinorhizobium meliloti WSM1022]|jgi:hypothetical protein|uniref:hypothetical protein n=1 Tax=Rhizobium meliloti TaxID=382 RepID=UPI0004087902|nr:hypothetical protein [Sinorhizobium meliloti]ASQ02968.1 hypothetical protein CDO23_02810 [Sinorhizobium meliloti]MCO6426179.1 hypothetical protein [Sinorhizobium meliloti]MDW9412807.1 hypothetical protein [Sinorhizobium meliloti]MDW9443861.1 hypothetical protein [Sinorhizobium meliloti]MDW9458273.1 hypothetical protein [Sinorhizobium meliloti]